MAQGNRSKEVWLIPKRGSLHQTICLIDGIKARNYSGTVWNPQKQNNLGVNLKNWGATKDGKNVSHQSIRTLTASIPQYLGFLYIDTNTTPNTIRLTKAGEELWLNHKDDLVKIENLVKGKNEIIKQSVILLRQMEKLQITNPIILKDCENILLFPFRMTLKLLLELDYLDKEELAYIVFKMKDETEYKLAVTEIKKLRKMSMLDRKEIIDAFKETHIGSITLAKAPSSGYYQSLCVTTGIIEKGNIKYPNDGNDNQKITCIKIKDDCKEYVKYILNEKYIDFKVYDFKNNLDLWIEYIGNPQRLSPPQNIELINNSNLDILVCITKDDKFLDGELIRSKSSINHPMFIGEEYKIQCIDKQSGDILDSKFLIPHLNQDKYIIDINTDKSIQENTLEDIAKEILEHSESKAFSSKMMNYLSILCKIDGKDRTSHANLRGGYYEYLFYELLSTLMNDGVIDEVIWNGKVGEYGLPTSAPGGKHGIYDMVFRIDDIDFVLELTTIKPKSAQFSVEGSSVPDHIKIYSENSSNNVVGIFCAPQIHDRNMRVMQSSLNDYNIRLNGVTDSDFINLLLTKDRKQIVSALV